MFGMRFYLLVFEVLSTDEIKFLYAENTYFATGRAQNSVSICATSAKVFHTLEMTKRKLNFMENFIHSMSLGQSVWGILFCPHRIHIWPKCVKTYHLALASKEYTKLSCATAQSDQSPCGRMNKPVSVCVCVCVCVCIFLLRLDYTAHLRYFD